MNALPGLHECHVGLHIIVPLLLLPVNRGHLTPGAWSHLANKHILDSELLHLLFAIGWFLVDQDIRSKMVVVKIVNLMIILFLGGTLQCSDRGLVDDVKRSAGNEVTFGVSWVNVKHLPPRLGIFANESLHPWLCL